MTPRQADKIIKAGQPVKFFNPHYNEYFTGIPVSRDRYSIKINVNGHIALCDRDDLQIVNQ